MDSGLKAAIEKAGGVRALARRLGLHHNAILQWKRIPADRIIEIEKTIGVPRDVLRPDLYEGWPPKKPTPKTPRRLLGAA